MAKIKFADVVKILAQICADNPDELSNYVANNDLGVDMEIISELMVQIKRKRKNKSIENSDEELEINEPAPKKRVYGPSCLRKFDIERFNDFIRQRSKINALLDEQIINIDAAKNFTDDLISLFNNVHILAYFYYKLCLSENLKSDSKAVIHYLNKGRTISDHQFYYLRYWGEIISHGSMQWLAGVPADGLNYMTVYNWKVYIKTFASSSQLYTKVKINGVDYRIPNLNTTLDC
jgi:hypothetical protein